MKKSSNTEEIVAELKAALRHDSSAAIAFRTMPPSHQREYCRYVGEAKKSETRQHRAEKAIRMIHAWAQQRAARAGFKKP